MKRFAYLALLATACAPQPSGYSAPDSAVMAAAATITAPELYERIAFLASDDLRGRDTPSPGLETAARWIADELAAFGLEPAGDDGWLQRYPYPEEALDAQRAELAAVAGATHSFEYGREFLAWRGAPAPGIVRAVYMGGSGGAASAADPSSTIVRDRALIVELEGLPEPGPAGPRFARGTRDMITETQTAAREAGAAAVVFILEAPYGEAEVAALARAAEEPRRTLGGIAETDRPVPTFFITRPTADRMFRMAGVDFAELRTTDGARPVPLERLSLQLAAPPRIIDDARPPNVVGVLRGSDPALRDTYVVLSAHMDHVGVGRPDATGDSIYNGADDDASGTSVLLEVAQALADLDHRPRRSVLFVAVSGEEKGLLLGSRWFSEHPTVPLESMVANINLDMVGRNAPDSIVVIGQEYSSLGRTVRDVAARHADELRLTVAEDIWPEQRFFFRSDHFNFARKEIPALFFFAGIHEDYHRPGDEVDEIDTDKTARVGRLVFYLTHQIAQSPAPPEWDRQGLEAVRRLTRQ